jgi:hypothetical protein
MKLMLLQQGEIFTLAISNTLCKMVGSTFANSIGFRCQPNLQAIALDNQDSRYKSSYKSGDRTVPCDHTYPFCIRSVIFSSQ